MPVRLLQGTADEDVPASDAKALHEHADGPDIQLRMVEGADHRFSAPEQLQMIRDAVAEVSGD